jgi:hypothetical protein
MLMSTAFNTRLERLEHVLVSGAQQVFAYGAGTKEDLDRLIEVAPDLPSDAIASVVWFQWGSPLRIEWGPAGGAWGDARRRWPAH